MASIPVRGLVFFFCGGAGNDGWEKGNAMYMYIYIYVHTYIIDIYICLYT